MLYFPVPDIIAIWKIAILHTEMYVLCLSLKNFLSSLDFTIVIKV